MSQPMHTVFPGPVVYPPAVQLTQIAALVAREAVEKVPAEHRTQAPALVAEYFPPVQLRHSVAPCIENFPAPQSAQVDMVVA